MCNLKSNKNLKEMLEYKKQLKDLNFSNCKFILFPSFVYLSLFYDAKFLLGSQNISKYKEGSHTGEVLASQLKSLKVSYTLINHTETHEKHKNIIKKIQNATLEKIKVVLCFGEKSENQDAIPLLKNDLKEIFNQLEKKEQLNIILAYEPSYAINNLNKVNPIKIENIVYQIKQFILETYSIQIQIVYGGSVNPINFLDLAKIDKIDGFLLGNSANNPKNIEKIIETI